MFGIRTREYLPWMSLGRQLGQFNRIFGDLGTSVESQFPAFNMYADAEGAVLSAQLPGVDLSEVELTVSGKTVTIKGNRVQSDSESGQFIRRERKGGEFVRTFELPFAIESSRVEAKSSKGMLRIDLPRAEADKPRRIEVKAS